MAGASRKTAAKTSVEYQLFAHRSIFTVRPALGTPFSAQHGLHVSAEHQGGQEGARRYTYQELAACKNEHGSNNRVSSGRIR